MPDVLNPENRIHLILFDHFQGKITKSMMRIGALYAPLIFLLSLSLSLTCGIRLLNWLNPINYYLIFVNGLICGITLIHRIILINRTKKKLIRNNEPIEPDEESMRLYKNFPAASYAIIGTIVILLAILSQSPNYHHEINYVGPSHQVSLSTDTTFLSFTEKFINRLEQGSSKNKIYCIAAEGGGLRAAYWTMMVLNELDQDVLDHTFMMTGASGGGIGMGMYTLFEAMEIGYDQRDSIIQKLAEHNYLTTDAAGALTRGIAGSLLPFPFMKSYWDRHRYMSSTYFELTGITDIWDSVGVKPFHELWQNRTNHLPMLVVNTTKTIDGSRAVVHPFPLGASPFDGQYTDLSSINRFRNSTRSSARGDVEYISYADAIFLTNRFPVASPPAKVEGRGYFVDGGYYDNSGLQTILHTLAYMKGLAEKEPESVFGEFFNKYDIEVINIRNSSTAYYGYLIDTTSYDYSDVNLIAERRQIGNILSATAGGGLSALPNYYHQVLRDHTVRSANRYGRFIVL